MDAGFLFGLDNVFGSPIVLFLTGFLEYKETKWPGKAEQDRLVTMRVGIP